MERRKRWRALQHAKPGDLTSLVCRLSFSSPGRVSVEEKSGPGSSIRLWKGGPGPYSTSHHEGRGTEDSSSAWENVRLQRWPGAPGHNLVFVGGAQRGCWRPHHLLMQSPGSSSPSFLGIVLSCEALPSPACVCGERAPSKYPGKPEAAALQSQNRRGLSSAATHISDQRESSRIRSQTLSRHHRRPVPPTGGHDAENLRPRARGASGLHRPETVAQRLRREGRARVRILLVNRAQRPQAPEMQQKLLTSPLQRIKSGKVPPAGERAWPSPLSWSP